MIEGGRGVCVDCRPKSFS